MNNLTVLEQLNEQNKILNEIKQQNVENVKENELVRQQNEIIRTQNEIIRIQSEEERKEEINSINEQLDNKANKNKVSPDEFNGDIQNCLDYASVNNCNVEFPSNKEYIIENTIYLPTNVSINFNNSIIRTNNDIVMLATKPTEKLYNVKLENVIIRGAGDKTFTNNIGFKFASIYGIFENFTISYCYNGVVQHSENVEGNQVTNIFRNFKIRYVYDIGMKLGDNSDNKITDGWLENINIGSGAGTTPINHLTVGGCSGYFFKDIHTWGSCESSIRLYEVAHTNFDGLYIESFNINAIQLHLKSECNMSNIKTEFNSNDECFMFLSGSTTSLYNTRVLNINNVIIGQGASGLTGLKIFNTENKVNLKVNYNNINVDCENYTFNAYPTRITALSNGIFTLTSKNDLAIENEFVLTRAFKKQIGSGTTITVDIPITHTFIGNDGVMVNLQITLCRYWDDFNNNVVRCNKNLYLYCKASGDVKIKEYDVEETIGFTVTPTFTFNSGILNITFEKPSASNGWLIATIN